MHTCIHAYMHTCIHAYMHTFIHSYIHTFIHSYIHTFIHTDIHTYTHTHIHTYTHTHIHTYTHTHIHTYTHTHIHTYITLHYITLHTYIHDPIFRPRGPPPWYGSPGTTPPSLLFASYWQHFWGPASYLLGFCSDSDYQPRIYIHLLGTCYLLDDLRSTHTPSKYLRATYSHIIHVLCIYLTYIYMYIYML